MEGVSSFVGGKELRAKVLISPLQPSFPLQKPDDKGALLILTMVSSWGNRAGRREVESRQGGEQKIPNTIIFTVSADLGKQNGKESDHLSESVIWNIL